MKLVLSCVLFFCIGGAVSAQTPEFAGQDAYLSGMLPLSRTERDFHFNPTAFVLLDTLANANINLRYGTFGGESLHSLFEGNGGNRTGVEAAGYRILPGKGVYSGAASWETGENRNVRWTNVRDAEMLYPYLVADSLGGDYQYESYKLEGSWAIFHKRGIYGLRGKYRGEVAYRLRDPRPKNTVSELTLNPGATWLFERWYAGTFFSYTFYRQHLDTKIETPYRKDRFFVLRGMGLYDLRFSTDESTFSRYYRQHEYQAGAQIGQLHRGLSGRFTYSRRKMEVEENDRRKPFLLTTDRADIALEWRKTSGRMDYLLHAGGGISTRSGTERSYEKIKSDTTTGAYVWRKLTEAEKIKIEDQYAQIGILMQHLLSERQIWWYGIDACWWREEERYLTPVYTKILADVQGILNVGFRRLYGKKRLDAEIWGGYKKNVSSSLTLPEQQIVVKNMLLPEYDYRRQDYAMARLRLDFRFPVYKQALLAVYSDSRGAYVSGDQYRWQTEAGICFEF